MTAVPQDIVVELQQENARLLAELRAATDRQNANGGLAGLVDEAELQKQVDVLTRQLREARELQAATAEVLQVINSSPGNLASVFEAILAKAHRLCGVAYGSLQLYDGERFRAVAVHDLPEQFADLLRNGFRASDHPVGRAFLAGERLVHLPDCSETDHPVMQSAVELAGIRTALFVPLRRDEALLGMIVCCRREIKLFTQKEIALLEGFAAQASVAIENARLRTETRESLERQMATADILKVIASSPSDVQPVFEAIATRANALLSGFSTAVFRFIDGIGHLAAFTPTNPAADDIFKKSFPRPIADFETFAIAQAGKVVQTPDIENLANEIKHIARARGFRSMMFVPLISSGAVIGMISVTRKETGHFADHHVQLLQTFADQAVIAIENARLFNQVQQRTRDLTEALQQQTAIGDVLKIISRSTFDLQPVLDTLVRTVARLCDTEMAFIMRREGNVYRAGAAVGYTKQYIEFLKNHPIAPDRGTITGRAVLERRPVQITDVAADPEYTLRESTTLAGQHTALCVPLLREGEPIGTIVLARQRVEPFTEQQIELVATFADQAVIAIENVRLFDELRQRTDDLSESLQQQTATADVLKVISRSTFDLPNVLNTLVSSAARLCGDPRAAIYLIRDGLLHLEAAYNNSAEWIDLRRSQPLAPNHDTPSGRAALSGQIDHVPDLLKDPEFKRLDLASLGDYRATLNVPLIREGITIGVLSLARPEPGPFTLRQIEIGRVHSLHAGEWSCKAGCQHRTAAHCTGRQCGSPLPRKDSWCQIEHHRSASHSPASC